MCGIFGAFYCCKRCRKLYKELDITYFNKTIHRGPDNTNLVIPNKQTILGFHLLSQIGNKSNLQPYMHDNRYFFVCNGEIYNFKDIDSDEQNDCKILFNFIIQANMDLESIKTFLQNTVNGEYSFIFYDTLSNNFIVGRDMFGVRPLYFSERRCVSNSKQSSLIFCSELKGINTHQSFTVEHFSPGTIASNNDCKKFRFNLKYNRKQAIPYNLCKKNIKLLLTKAVRKRIAHFDIESEKRFGCLLSGGLDSSLVTAIAFTELTKKYGLQYAQDNMYVFSIYYGKEYSEDILEARKLSSVLQIKHHYIFNFDMEDIIENIEDVIGSIETYDISTIRASIPQYILAYNIKSTFPFIRCVLTGEGADEVFGGYKYLKGNLDNDILLREYNKLIKNIHYYDGLRTDRTMSKFGIEVRVPFLDTDLVKYVFQKVPMNYKKPTLTTEKDILREAFLDYNITESVLKRRKEAFSDSISNSHEKNWFKVLFKNIEEEKEYYNEVFCNWYSNLNYYRKIIPGYWMPPTHFTNGKIITDPSAKVL